MTDAPHPAPATESPRKPRRSWKRRLAWLGAILLILLISLELFARLYLGLGDPPLFVADPQIEYLNKPSSHARRFGNNVTFNEFSMRSGPVTRTKTDPNEFRVLVVGDSIVNGGGQTDDADLATAIVQTKLNDALRKPVYVGNISAGSWGPPNQLAYLKRYGFFDADALVLVWNSDDYCDVPTFAHTVGVAPEQPDHAPLLALQEGFTRYLLPYFRAAPAPATAAPSNPPAGDILAAQNAIREIIQLSRSAGIKQILIVQWPDSRELGALESPGHATILATSHELGIDPIQLAPAFTDSLKQGKNPYRDVLHPNDLGQQLLADAILAHLLPQLAPTTQKAQ